MVGVGGLSKNRKSNFKHIDEMEEAMKRIKRGQADKLRKEYE